MAELDVGVRQARSCSWALGAPLHPPPRRPCGARARRPRNGLPSPAILQCRRTSAGRPAPGPRPRQGRAAGCTDFPQQRGCPRRPLPPGRGLREELRPALSGQENGRAGGRLMKARYARCPPRSIGGSAALPGAGAPPAPAAAWTLLRGARTAAPGPPTRPRPRASYPPPPGNGPVAVRRPRFQRVLGVLVPEACCL